MSTAAIVLLAVLGGIIGWELAGWLTDWRRCIAVRDKRPGEPHWGRCDLQRGHAGLHTLERGADSDVYWSTAEVPAVDVELADQWSFRQVFDVPDDQARSERRAKHRRRPRP